MYRICKRFSFEAAHKLRSAFSQECSENVHGHSYVVDVVLAARCLNADGMVVDFGRLKQFIDVLRGDWDHALILHKDDAAELKIAQPRMIVMGFNPTAEIMAALFFAQFKDFVKRLQAHKGQKLRVEWVRVHETATGWAEYTEEPEVTETCP